MDEFLKRKLTLAFGLFDADGDGFLELSDFDAIADKYSELRGWAPGDPGHTRFREFFGFWWARMQAVADVNLDGKVTPEETYAMFASATREEMLAAGELIFDVIDADADGDIEPEEYEIFLKGVSIDWGSAAEAFSRLDEDGDGVISREQFAKLFADYYGSEDEDVLGNYLFGIDPRITSPAGDTLEL